MTTFTFLIIAVLFLALLSFLLYRHHQKKLSEEALNDYMIWQINTRKGNGTLPSSFTFDENGHLL